MRIDVKIMLFIYPAHLVCNPVQVPFGIIFQELFIAEIRFQVVSWNWLYSRLVVCIRPDGRCFDVSDAGMVIYMLTGIEKTYPALAQQIMENPEPRK